MSVGPMTGVAGGAAATSVAQTAGSEMDRAEQATASQERRVRHEQLADKAAGIGQPDGDNHETADRDADGRRPWEFPNASVASPSEHVAT
jgi:hypothetical protein